jgi:CRP-like cAMP-binding protein
LLLGVSERIADGCLVRASPPMQKATTTKPPPGHGRLVSASRKKQTQKMTAALAAEYSPDMYAAALALLTCDSVDLRHMDVATFPGEARFYAVRRRRHRRCDGKVHKGVLCE